jgi:hypothetical protein
VTRFGGSALTAAAVALVVDRLLASAGGGDLDAPVTAQRRQWRASAGPGAADDRALDGHADHVDTIAHELAELLGDPSALAEPDAAAPDARKGRDGAPMLTSIAGGAP